MAASSITFFVSWHRKMMRFQIPLLACCLALAGCSPAGLVQTTAEAAVPASEASVETVTAAELSKLIADNKVVLIDVRTPAEFAEARLAGALNAPLQTFDPASIPIEAKRETILYCRSSGRSGQAAKILADHLQRKVRHMEGGIIAWQEAGLPVISQP